jgi:hypothetical protein
MGLFYIPSIQKLTQFDIQTTIIIKTPITNNYAIF